MKIFEQWSTDPEASATIAVALVAGLFAIYQLRSIPADRLRRTLDAMTKSYASSRQERANVLKRTPPLLLLGYGALGSALDAQASEISVDDIANTYRGLNARRLRQELDDWKTPELGISHFSADEIRNCEVKFRALLWSIAMIRAATAAGAAEPVAPQHVQDVKNLVDKLNDFLTDYENGVFPSRTMLGKWHTQMAQLAAACTPFIWEKSIPSDIDGKSGSRWGRSVLRIGVTANHYNDVSDVGHRLHPIIWKPKGYSSGGVEVVVHHRLTREMLGAQILVPGVPGIPRVLPYYRLWMRQTYWGLVGWASLKPRGRFTAYGGRRLALHKRSESDLEALLRYAAAKSRESLLDYSVDLDWSLDGLKEELRRTKSAAVRAGSGRPAVRWLYLRSSQSSNSSKPVA